jgi:preprotein translocase subunit SecE
MAKTDDAAPGFRGEVFKFDLYKRNQGRLIRQLTALGLAVIVGFGAWTLYQSVLMDVPKPARVAIPAAICLVGGWLIFRLVNYPRFADFLISVQAEMDKVTWPDRKELIRATGVVLVGMFFLGSILYAFDLIWVTLFTALGILRGS